MKLFNTVAPFVACWLVGFLFGCWPTHWSSHKPVEKVHIIVNERVVPVTAIHSDVPSSKSWQTIITTNSFIVRGLNISGIEAYRAEAYRWMYFGHSYGDLDPMTVSNLFRERFDYKYMP